MINLDKIPNDKLLHFFYGSIVSFITLLFVDIFHLNPVLIPVTTLIVAVGKEVYDKFIRKTKFDVIDIVFTIITSIVLYIHLLIV